MVDSVYLVAAAPLRNRQVFDEIRAVHPGTWVLATTLEELTLERLRALNPSRVFFLHWSWKVPAEIVRRFECVGFHMTDLPYGRGGSPLQNLILRGHRTTMLSAFRLVEAFDAGPVYLKAELSLDGRAEDIYLRASRLAARLIGRILNEHPEPAPQEGEVVVFRRRTPEESRLPSDASPEQLYDFIRMLDADGYPRAFADIGAYRCELSHATLEGGVLRAHAAFTMRPDGTRSL
jgi:methionyl-tRNA formyltransferase